MRYSLTKIFFVFAFFVSFPIGAIASELRLDTSKVDVRVGEEFTVEVIMNTDELVNAVEGTIIFSDTLLEMKEIRDGNSSINFWIEKPHLESEGELVFSGITPGGFSGVSSRLFSVIFEAKQEGVVTISIVQAKALKNDGVGTEIPFVLRDVTVAIKAGDGGVRKEIIEDTVPPEPFTPIITHDLSLYDGKSFVTFGTQDKDSGVSGYQIKEYRLKLFSFLSSWKTAEIPYLLSDQKLKSHIFIRAVDNAGNIRVSEIAPTHPLLWYEYVSYWSIIVGVLICVLYVFLKHRKKDL